MHNSTMEMYRGIQLLSPAGHPSIKQRRIQWKPYPKAFFVFVAHVLISRRPGLKRLHQKGLKVVTWLDFLPVGYRVLKGPGGLKKGRRCSWGTLRIPFGKIGEP